MKQHPDLLGSKVGSFWALMATGPDKLLNIFRYLNQLASNHQSSNSKKKQSWLTWLWGTSQFSKTRESLKTVC